MSTNKTVPTTSSVSDFIDSVHDSTKREDSHALVTILSDITGQKATMWGPAIIGFGKYHYKYASGHEGDAPLIAFSPRKQTLTLYTMDGAEEHRELFKKLGPHSTSVSCLYVKRLSHIDLDVLKEIMKRAYAHAVKRHGTP